MSQPSQGFCALWPIWLLSAVLVLGISALHMAQQFPPLLAVSIPIWVAIGLWAAVLLPCNLLHLVGPRIAARSARVYQGLRALAAERKQLGLLSFVWVFGHYHNAVWFLRETYSLEELEHLHPLLNNGQAAFLVFIALTITSWTWLQYRLNKLWQPVHSLLWALLPMAATHAASANGFFSQSIPWPTLALLVGLIGFAFWEAWRHFRGGGPGGYRHLLLVVYGCGVAVFLRFIYQN